MTEHEHPKHHPKHVPGSEPHPASPSKGEESPHVKIQKHHASRTHAHTETGLEKDEEQAIETGLHAIYGEDKTDFTKIERPRNFITQLLLTLVIVLSVLAGTAWGGYFVYQKYFAPASSETFTVNIKAPEQIKSGERLAITIHYSNPTSVPLAQLTIDARLPTGFIVETSNPLAGNLAKPTWDIGYLNAGSDGEITLEGIWIATVPSTTPLQVFANFRPANFNSDFQAVETVSVTSLQTVLESTFSGSEEATPGEAQEYLLTIQNTGSETVKDVIAEIKLPIGFYLDKSAPELAAASEPVWTIASLEPGAKSEIKLTGSFAADVTGFQYFDATISLKDGNDQLTQTTAQTFTDVKGSTVSLQLVAAGSSTDSALFLGDNLRVSLAYENTSEEPMNDVAILLDFSSEKTFPIDWKTANLAGGKLTKDGVLWSAETIGEVPAHEKKILSLDFPIVATMTEAFGDRFTLTALANVGNLSVRSTPITISINSNATLATEVRYFTADGAPLGAGPIPPMVGESTTYRVYWTVSNSLHNLENMTVTAILPPHATWNNQTTTDLGTVAYKDISGEVVWTLSALPEDVQSVSANFAISITPKTEDVGKFVKLISGSNFKVTDSFTKALIEQTGESLDTELPTDVFASGKGAVVEAPAP